MGIGSPEPRAEQSRVAYLESPHPPPQAQVEVLVNQEGNMDLQPSGNSSPHEEADLEVQSTERNDL
jgi:hypothetical protein